MTENEAIKVLKDEHSYGYELNKACLIAIKALEEIKQYRAIGTVEELKEIMRLCRNLQEKNTSKKVVFAKNLMMKEKIFFCPFCRRVVESVHIHCWNCGQKLDWE